MNSEFERKLASLREDYSKNLPAKIEELEHLWNSLQQQWSAEVIDDLHRKTHSLNGSASTYGFRKLSSAAAQLEALLRAVHKINHLSAEHKLQISKLLGQVKLSASKTVMAR